jgi:NitT/TauT family transport system substrate-binding protein
VIPKSGYRFSDQITLKQKDNWEDKAMTGLQRTVILAGLMTALAGPGPGHAAERTIRVGWCTPSYNAVVAPWAVAKKMGWDKAEGINVELVPVATGIDCVKFVATGEFPFAIPSIEPLAGLVAQGLKAKTFYNMFNGSGWQVAVPEDSPIKTIADLKGKKVGVISLAAVGATIAKGLVKDAGLVPDKDVKLVTVGEAPRAMLFLRSKEIDAVSIFESAHLQISALGVKLRTLPAPVLETAPQIGLIATDATLAARREDAVALGRILAKGTAYTMANIPAALDITYTTYPQMLPTGKPRSETEAIDRAFLQRRAQYLAKRDGSGTSWGEMNSDYFNRYLGALAEWGLTPRLVSASELLTTDLTADINKFDDAPIVKQAQSYTAN